MPTELWLLRHAKSDWPADVRSDLERPLNARGRESAPRMGRHMAAQGWLPDRVLCSPARRTRETLEGLLGTWPVAPPVDYEPQVYEAALPDLLAALAPRLQGEGRLLLIGHNPGVLQLLRHLAQPPLALPEPKLYPTCMLARLALDARQPLAPQRAQVLGLQPVRELPA